jgi:outer membrane protein assembly factor BamA
VPARTQAGDHRLIAVNVHGTERYTPQQIMAATDLHIGDTVSEDIFNRAVQLLGEAGVFNNVAFTYSYSAAGTKLELTVSDNDKLVPVQFENIVWMTDDQLIAEMKRRVPLFLGKAPLGGNLVDQLSDALQATLLQNHWPGHATYIRNGPENGPIDSVIYSVDNVTLKIREVKVTGAGPDELPLLQAKAQRMVDGDYSSVHVLSFAHHDLLPILTARGYLRAAFQAPKVTVHEQTEEEVRLDMILNVDPGRIYKLAQVEWSGNNAFPADKLSPLLHVAAGQVANGVQINSDLDDVRKLYTTRGYMRSSVKPDPQFDDDKGTVTYRLLVNEGDLYKMGDLDIRGLDSRTTTELRGKWTLARGSPYDSSYTKNFIEAAWKSLASQVDWTVNAHEAIDDQEKTVDVSLVYGVRASR